MVKRYNIYLAIILIPKYCHKLQGDALRQSLLVRYFNGGNASIGGMSVDNSSDNGIDDPYQDGDNVNGKNTYDDEDKGDDISTVSGCHKSSTTTGDSMIKTTNINHQQQNLPPSTKSWSPPPPISFRPEQQQQQQQHRVTHGPGG